MRMAPDVRLGRGGPEIEKRLGRSSMSAFVAFGHSHVVALARGFDKMLAEPRHPNGSFHYLHDPRFSPNLIEEDGRETLNPKMRRLVDDVGSGPVVLSVAGNEHNVLSILQTFPTFDFILGERPDIPLERTAEVFPEAMVRETLRDWLDDAFRLLAAFRAASSAPMAQIEAPPPLPRDRVLACPGELLSDATSSDKLSPESFRYKVWRVQAALYRETCRKCGIIYVPVFPDMIDDAGMLAAPFHGNDATHANAAFGHRMMKEAFHLLGTQ